MTPTVTGTNQEREYLTVANCKKKKKTLRGQSKMETLADLRVELFRAPGKSLGISIVGGRGMGSRLNNGEVMRGIFIKHILVDSPAGQNGTLKTGDRIVEVKEVKQGTFKFETPKPGVVSQYQTIDLTLTFWKMYLGGWS